MTHTAFETNPWWQVDLGQTYGIAIIEIYNRTDCCQDRLTNYNVSILDENGVAVAVYQESSCPNPSKKIFCALGIKKGRYVRIQLRCQSNYLSLAEVQVYEAINLAYHG